MSQFLHEDQDNMNAFFFLHLYHYNNFGDKEAIVPKNYAKINFRSQWGFEIWCSDS